LLQETRGFRKQAHASGTPRSFVQFILEPLYKIVSHVVGEHPKVIEKVLGELGVFLKPSSYEMDSKPLLKEACGQVFGSSAGLVEMMVEHVPSSRCDGYPHYPHSLIFFSHPQKHVHLIYPSHCP
jgi:U5 small nuclear ribonucleoprotein component